MDWLVNLDPLRLTNQGTPSRLPGRRFANPFWRHPDLCGCQNGGRAPGTPPCRLARQPGPPQVDDPRGSVEDAWRPICEPILAPSRPLCVPIWQHLEPLGRLWAAKMTPRHPLGRQVPPDVAITFKTPGLYWVYIYIQVFVHVNLHV